MDIHFEMEVTMKKHYTLHKLFSLALIVSMVGLFTACGCGRNVEPNNTSTNNSTNNTTTHTTTETGMNTIESDRYNGSMGNTDPFGTTDGMVNSTTNGTNDGIVGGVVDDIVGGVDNMMNGTETGINHSVTTETTIHNNTTSRMR